MTSKRPSRTKSFVVCMRNDGYEASLERRKIYRTLADQKAAKANLVRVIDESGEGYLYPADFFHPIALPNVVERALKKAG